LEAANVCVLGAKFPWVCRLLSKVHPKLFKIVKLITELLKKRNKYIWGDACDEAFKVLKKLQTMSPVLTQPDIAKPFDVYCDASATGLGSVLMQEGRVISYSS
jgi:hypothetical protein